MKVVAFSETGQQIGEYEVHDLADMHTAPKLFPLFGGVTEMMRDAFWKKDEALLGDYDLIGVSFMLMGLAIQETRLYARKGKYTYTETPKGTAP